MSRARTEVSGIAFDDGSPFSRRAAGGAVLVRVRVMPRARRAGVEGVVADAEGRPALKIAVTAPPADGAANAAVLALLAREWRLPKSSLSVVAGASSRSKTIAVAAEGREEMAALLAWSRSVAPAGRTETETETGAEE